MLDVLNLLPVTWGLFQGLDDKSCGGGNHINFSLTILDGQPDGNFKTFPFLSGFGDVVTNFFGRQTQWTDLGGQSGSGSDFSSDSTKADDLTKSQTISFTISLFDEIFFQKDFFLQISVVGKLKTYSISVANYVIISKKEKNIWFFRRKI